MLTCSTDIVTCLRNENVEPYTTASVLNSDSTKLPYTVFAYDLDQNQYYLHTSPSEGSQKGWFFSDLKKAVYLNSYKLTEDSGCSWASEWTFYVSLDNNEWKVIDTKSDYSYNAKFQLQNVYLARYINITGSAIKCSTSTFAIMRLYLYGAFPLKASACNHKNQIVQILLIFVLIILPKA